MTPAKDLSKEPPRSPRTRLGGYALMARMADKGRADLHGTGGEYKFNCPLDQMLFEFKGVDAEQVKPLLQALADDDEIVAWFNTHGTPKTVDQVQAWSDGLDNRRPYEDPDSRAWFAGECEKLGLDPKNTTLFDYLETDDRASFGK